jgi:hypothetical protein
VLLTTRGQKYNNGLICLCRRSPLFITVVKRLLNNVFHCLAERAVSPWVRRATDPGTDVAGRVSSSATPGADSLRPGLRAGFTACTMTYGPSPACSSTALDSRLKISEGRRMISATENPASCAKPRGQPRCCEHPSCSIVEEQPLLCAIEQCVWVAVTVSQFVPAPCRRVIAGAFGLISSQVVAPQNRSW